MHVEIWSDIVCPWCYIGKRRFEAALARFAHADAVRVTWRSFQLDPSSPRTFEGSLDEMLARKLGRTVAEARAMNQRVTALAAEEGLEYHLDRARPGNTFDAHRGLHLAASQGLGAAAKERVLRAYFTEGAEISDHEVLVRLLADVGVDADAARAALAGDAFADAVRADAARARALGATGVPFFVFDQRYGVSGAQPADLFLEVLEKAYAERAPSMITGDGPACEGDACELPEAK